MSAFHQFVSEILADKRIHDTEVPRIRDYLFEDGHLDLDDVRLLVELYCEADEYCPAFEHLFFSVLEEVFLADGEIQPIEQFYLLKMIYSDREIREPEKLFLHKLKRAARQTTPEFDALYDEAMEAHPTAWSVGGK